MNLFRQTTVAKDMSHLVSALYHDREKARLAAGDLIGVGVDVSQILYAEGLSEGSGRLEIQARSMDQAINVQSFLQEDGAHSVEIRPGFDSVAVPAPPTVPA